MEDRKSSTGLSTQRVNLFQYLAADLPFHRNGGTHWNAWNALVLIISVLGFHKIEAGTLFVLMLSVLSF